MSTTKDTKRNIDELKVILKSKSNGSTSVRMNKRIFEILKEHCDNRGMANFVGMAVIEKLEREQ